MGSGADEGSWSVIEMSYRTIDTEIDGLYFLDVISFILCYMSAVNSSALY